jgi:hypothetical protein
MKNFEPPALVARADSALDRLARQIKEAHAQACGAARQSLEGEGRRRAAAAGEGRRATR